MAIVSFTDSLGREWQVLEVRRSLPPLAVSPGREDGWLSFSHAADRRRVSPVPAQWESLDPATLEVLCESGERVDPELTLRLLDRRSETRADPAEVDGSSARVASDVVLTPELRDWIREHARAAHVSTQTVIAGLMELRQHLNGLGIPPASGEFRAARRAFLEAYYFER
jgi:hypothetical protein